MSTVRVVYVGLKEREVDSVAGTDLVWVGAGDVQDVPIEAWEKLANHPDVWSLEESAESEDVGDDGSFGLADVQPREADQFDGMDDVALRVYAGKHLIKVHHKQTGDRLRAVIRQTLDAKE